jgi:transposase
MVSTGSAVPLSRGDGPGRATLRRLYVVEQWSMADLQARYRVGSPTVRRWLVEAGIQVRPPGSGGFRRQLFAPSRRELAELGRDLPTSAIAKRLGVSGGTVRRWFAEAGLTPPSGSLKNRPRGAPTAVQRPAAERLRQLYVQDGLSIPGVAERLDSTTHLVRTWLLEDDIPIRPGRWPARCPPPGPGAQTPAAGRGAPASAGAGPALPGRAGRPVPGTPANGVEVADRGGSAGASATAGPCGVRCAGRGDVPGGAKLHDCAINTVLRWLAQAGVTVPGRGQWTRKKSGRPENEAQ